MVHQRRCGSGKICAGRVSDLTEKRLTKSDVLEKLKDQMILLSGEKGYSVEDIRSALKTVGIQTIVKAIREILNAQKNCSKGTASSRRKITKDVTPATSTEAK